MDETDVGSASRPLLRIGWREVGLVLGYLGLAALGILEFSSAQPAGIALLMAALAGIAFLHRQVLPAAIWVGAAVWAAVQAWGGEPVYLLAAVAGVVEAGLASRRAELSYRAPDEVAESLVPVVENPRPATQNAAIALPVLEPEAEIAAASGNGHVAANFETAEPFARGSEVAVESRAQPEPVSTEGADSAIEAEAPTVITPDAEPAPSSDTPAADSVEVTPNPVEVPSTSRGFPPLEIRTIGAIRLKSGDSDLSKEFLRKPKLSAVALVILVRYLEAPKQPIFIGHLATEVAWFQDEKSRDATLKMLSDVEGDRFLPLLGCRISHDAREDTVRFRPDGCRIDFLELRQLASQLRPLQARIDSAQQVRAKELLEEVGAGTFLPNWEGRTAAFLNKEGEIGSVVNALRWQSRRDRAEIAAALGFARYGQQGQLEEAQHYLELAYEMDGGRADVASRLETIYKEIGRQDLIRHLQERQQEVG